MFGVIETTQDATTYNFNSHSLVYVIFPNQILHLGKDHKKSLKEREERERGREREREREREATCVCVCVPVCENHCVHDTDPVKYFNEIS